jgi:penicillin-binding protein 1C
LSSVALRGWFDSLLPSRGRGRVKSSPALENGAAHPQDAAARERQRLRAHYEAQRAKDSLRPPTAAGVRAARARMSRKVRPHTAERWGRWLGIVALPLLIGATVVSACRSLPTRTTSFVTGIQSQVNRDVPTIPATGALDQGMPQTSMIMARDGSTLAEINDVGYGRRLVVPLSQMSPYLVLATVAAEDRRFFTHNGVDPIGFARALMQNATSDELASGASTLEMQLIRNLYMPDEKTEQTLSRKVREAVAAQQLDERVTKAEVIETYLNSVFYGNQAYGAEAAAQRYFGRSARTLTIAEAALLAGLPQSPIAYDPLLRFDQAKKRQEHVIELMQQSELITPEQARMAQAATLEFREPNVPEPRFQHWVNYVADLTRARFGPDALYTGGLRISTTLDPVVQSLAEEAVAHNEDIRVQARANNTAMVVIDPATSQVLAMVGSKDFWDQSIAGQVNVAIAGRQPGSSIKPLVYLAGFEKGLSPAVEAQDRITPFSAPLGQPPYVPKNFEDKYYGQVTLRDALGNSLNVPAVKVLKYVGVPAFKDLADRFGITTLDDWDPQWLSLTLGGGEIRLVELTNAYAAISRLGAYRPVESLLGVQTSRGGVLYAGSDTNVPRQVVDPRIAYQLLHIMGDSGARLVTFGPQTPLNLPRPHMMKTGTTDDFRDTWTIGCLPQVCVGVWMGNTNNEPMQRVSSSLTAGKIWVEMVQTLAERFNYPPIPFPQPDGIVVTRIPNVGVTRPSSSDHEEVFLAEQQGRGFLDMNWMEP